MCKPTHLNPKMVIWKENEMKKQAMMNIQEHENHTHTEQWEGIDNETENWQRIKKDVLRAVHDDNCSTYWKHPDTPPMPARIGKHGWLGSQPVTWLGDVSQRWHYCHMLWRKIKQMKKTLLAPAPRNKPKRECMLLFLIYISLMKKSKASGSTRFAQQYDRINLQMQMSLTRCNAKTTSMSHKFTPNLNLVKQNQVTKQFLCMYTSRSVVKNKNYNVKNQFKQAFLGIIQLQSESAFSFQLPVHHSTDFHNLQYCQHMILKFLFHGHNWISKDARIK